MPHAQPLAPARPAAFAALDAAREAALVAQLAGLYPQPTSLVFEIGCGHGHFLTAYAAANPSVSCLGVDLVKKRIACALRKPKRLGLNNVNFLNADASQVIEYLPHNVKIGEIFILFPDPWPKRHHHRRRFLQASLLEALSVRAEPGARLALRTDHAGFFTWASAQIESQRAWRLAPELPWPFEHSTVFQEMQGAHQSLMAVRR